MIAAGNASAIYGMNLQACNNFAHQRFDKCPVPTTITLKKFQSIHGNLVVKISGVEVF
jgi:hypothetical protein